MQLAWELEKDLIPSEDWTDEVIAHYPKGIQEELKVLRAGPPWKQDSQGRTLLPHPTGVGFREDVGWFCIGCGQGPFIIWLEEFGLEGTY